jgi:hypothetical protein
MIIHINEPQFYEIFKNQDLKLPVRWDGKDFEESVENLFKQYKSSLKNNNVLDEDISEVNKICDSISNCIKAYHNGFPNRAYNIFKNIMKKLYNDPLKIYPKSRTGAYNEYDPLDLYRVRNVSQNIIYKRADIFHTPYSQRAKISTCRYSIAGYPSLYLATSISLCCEETPKKFINDFTIISKFKLERYNHQKIYVIELGVKPSDFFEKKLDLGDFPDDKYREDYYNDRKTKNIHKRLKYLNEVDLKDPEIMGKYIYWYPLIAACSFIRKDKNEPFASEYIVPQLLMQWVRAKSINGNIIGLRYFSCASDRASNLGFNYVFPVSGDKYSDNPNFCNILRDTFKLTAPHYLNEYNSVQDCENTLFLDNDLHYI